MFFEKLEQEIYNNGLSDIALSLQIPLSTYHEKEKTNRGKSKIRNLFKIIITKENN